MKLGIIRLYCGESGKKGFYNIQEIGLAKSLIKKGIDVDIFFLSPNIKEKYTIEIVKENIRLITIKCKNISNHGIISLKVLDDFKIDVIQILADNQLIAPNLINYCRKRNIPYYCYIGTIESDSNNYIKKMIMNFISSRNIGAYKKSIIACKTTEIEKKLNDRGILNTKVIPVGLDLEIIPKIDSSIEELKRELSLDKEKKLLLFVGRLEEYKKPLKFIELMSFINERSSDYKGIIIGSGSLKEKIENEINNCGLEDKLLMIDKVDNKKIHQYYKVSDVFINFNENEIFGMSILEAMNQGCPVIAYNAPGPKYIINSGESGVLIDNYDFEEWFSIIKDITLNNSDIKRNSKKRILEVFNWDSIASEFIKTINEITL